MDSININTRRRTKILHLDEQMENLYSCSLYGSLYAEETNRKDKEFMKKKLFKAMQGFLTEQQLRCLTLYYLEEMTVKQVGETLGLHSSTVSRHISAAIKKLKKIQAYIC